MINTKLMFLAAVALIGTAACYTAYSGAFSGLSSDSGACSKGCCSQQTQYVAASKSACDGCTGDCCSDCSAGVCCGGTNCDCCSADVCTSCNKDADAAAAAAAVPVNVGEAGCCKTK